MNIYQLMMEDRGWNFWDIIFGCTLMAARQPEGQMGGVINKPDEFLTSLLINGAPLTPSLRTGKYVIFVDRI